MAVLQNVLDTFWDGYKLIQDPMIFTFMLFLNSQGGNLWKKGVLKSHGIYRSKIGPNFFNLTMITRPWIPKHWIFVQDKAFPPYFMRIYKKYSWSHYISIKTRWIWCWIAKITCTRKVIKICENQRNFKILTLKFCWSLPEKTINILMSLGYHPEQA